MPRRSAGATQGRAGAVCVSGAPAPCRVSEHGRSGSDDRLTVRRAPVRRRRHAPATPRSGTCASSRPTVTVTSRWRHGFVTAASWQLSGDGCRVCRLCALVWSGGTVSAFPPRRYVPVARTARSPAVAPCGVVPGVLRARPVHIAAGSVFLRHAPYLAPRARRTVRTARKTCRPRPALHG